MALPNNTVHISDFPTTTEVTPDDYVPIVRQDTDGTFGNYKTKSRNFISYPFGYLHGGDFVWTGTTCSIGATYCRDESGSANIIIESPISKSVDESLFYPAGFPTVDGTYYVVAARKSEADVTSSFFLTQNNGGALGSDWAYSRAVAVGKFSASTRQFSGIRCFDTEIVTVQESEIAPGAPLASGKIAIVIEPL